VLGLISTRRRDCAEGWPLQNLRRDDRCQIEEVVTSEE